MWIYVMRSLENKVRPTLLRSGTSVVVLASKVSRPIQNLR